MAGDDKPAGLDFLDFVFTLAMAQGLAPEVINRKGLLSEEWLTVWRPPSAGELFELGVFAVGFLTLTLSWYGYHASIKLKPLKYGTVPGTFRFVFDVLLVILYDVMLLEFKRFDAVLLLLVLTYFLFVVWDLLKIREHKDKYPRDGKPFCETYSRELVTGFWFVLFLLLYILRNILPTCVCLLLAILFTALYRIDKIKRWLWVRA